MTTGISASNLRRINKNTLVGTVDLKVEQWGISFRGCLWHRKGEREWVNFAAREWADSQGQRRFANLIELDRPVADRFQAAALAAIDALTERAP